MYTTVIYCKKLLSTKANNEFKGEHKNSLACAHSSQIIAKHFIPLKAALHV